MGISLGLYSSVGIFNKKKHWALRSSWCGKARGIGIASCGISKYPERLHYLWSENPERLLGRATWISEVPLVTVLTRQRYGAHDVESRHRQRCQLRRHARKVLRGCSRTNLGLTGPTGGCVWNNHLPGTGASLNLSTLVPGAVWGLPVIYEPTHRNFFFK